LYVFTDGLFNNAATSSDNVPSSGGVMNWNRRGNKFSCSDRRTVPAIALKALATITKNFYQDNRRHIRNSIQAPPGYKTDVMSGFCRGVVEPLALLRCLLTTFRHMSVPSPRIVYVGNQPPTYCTTPHNSEGLRLEQPNHANGSSSKPGTYQMLCEQFLSS
jgi:hypothetical protein